jgi:hypothetical protein
MVLGFDRENHEKEKNRGEEVKSEQDGVAYFPGFLLFRTIA